MVLKFSNALRSGEPLAKAEVTERGMSGYARPPLSNASIRESTEASAFLTSAMDAAISPLYSLTLSAPKPAPLSAPNASEAR